MKKTLMIFGAILLAALLSAGSFWGGMAYQSNRADRARANFMNARGLAGDGQAPDGGQFPDIGQFANGGAGFAGGRGMDGQVKTIDGNVMTLSTAQDVTTVNLTETTRVEKTVSGAIADLQPGMQVMVTGQRDDNGDVTASQVTILNTDPAAATDPSATGTEP
jgi:hypothetical protein